MNVDSKNAIIITAIGVIAYLFSMGMIAYIYHLSLWGLDSPLKLIFLAYIPIVLSPTTIGLLIVGSIKLYRNLKVKKLTIALIISAVFVLPSAMFILYQLIDNNVYDVKYSFTVEKWANASQDDRARIIPSFREQYQLVGENVEYVIPLLGTPDSELETKYYYNLGYSEAILVREPVYYLIEFSDIRIITSESIYQGWDLLSND